MSGKLVIPNKSIRIANDSIDTNILNDSFNVNNFIWSTSSLDWVKCTTSTSGEPVVAVTNFPATQAVTGFVSVSNFPATASTVTVTGSDKLVTGTMGANAVPFSIPFYGTPFSTGLTLAITGANSNAAIIFE